LTSQQGFLPSQQGLCAHTEQSISWGSGFIDNLQAAATPFSVTITESTGIVRTDKSSISWGRSSGDDFLVGRDSLSVMIFE